MYIYIYIYIYIYVYTCLSRPRLEAGDDLRPDLCWHYHVLALLLYIIMR